MWRPGARAWRRRPRSRSSSVPLRRQRYSSSLLLLRVALVSLLLQTRLRLFPLLRQQQQQQREQAHRPRGATPARPSARSRVCAIGLERDEGPVRRQLLLTARAESKAAVDSIERHARVVDPSDAKGVGLVLSTSTLHNKENKATAAALPFQAPPNVARRPLPAKQNSRRPPALESLLGARAQSGGGPPASPRPPSPSQNPTIRISAYPSVTISP